MQPQLQGIAHFWSLHDLCAYTHPRQIHIYTIKNKYLKKKNEFPFPLQALIFSGRTNDKLKKLLKN